MRPDNDPDEAELEALVTNEERRLLDDPNVPEEVKTEILERLERLRAKDLEEEFEDAGNQP